MSYSIYTKIVFVISIEALSTSDVLVIVFQQFLLLIMNIEILKWLIMWLLIFTSL